MSKKTNYFLIALASCPLIFCVLFISFVTRAIITLGYWPKYAHPDPQLLLFNIHSFATNVFALLSVITFFIWLFFFVFQLFSIIFHPKKNKEFVIKTAYYGLSWVPLLLMVYFDFGKLFDWYFD